jgi:hypothetical protein
MQTLDSIFLDKLDQLYCKKPKLWAPKKNYYVTLLELNKNNMLIENEDGSLHRMPRQEVCEQTLLLPSKESTDWSDWRRYLFENDVDFIAPSSYIFRAANGHHHLIESTYNLPYLVTDIENGGVMDARGEILIVDINRYRFANKNEIGRFLNIARDYFCREFEWDANNQIWKRNWCESLLTSKLPKFIPGDLVALKDYITGEIFEGCYYIKKITKTRSNDNYEYVLTCDVNLTYGSIIVPEESLVKCEVVIEEKVSNRVSEIIDRVINKKEQKEKEEEDFLL